MRAADGLRRSRRGLGESWRAACAHELRARARASARSRCPRRPRGPHRRRRPQPAGHGARAVARRGPPRQRHPRDSRGPHVAAQRPGNHAAHRRRPWPGQHRRREAAVARSRLAGIPEAGVGVGAPDRPPGGGGGEKRGRRGGPRPLRRPGGGVKDRDTDTTRSHCDAQDYMETGTPGVKSTPDGWLARAANALPEPASPLRAVALGPALPRILRGDVSAVAMQSLADFDVRRTGDQIQSRRGFESLYAQGVSDLLHGAGRETFEAVTLLKKPDAERLAPANGASYPAGRFGQSLRQIAQLIRADVGLEIAFADVGGWDTHVGHGNERGQLANRLRELAAALAAFTQDLGDRMADVAVLTMSELGRTGAENGNRGTDPGHATAILVLRGDVRRS